MKTNQNQTIIISTYDDIKNPHYGGGGAIAIHELAKRLKDKFAIKVLSWDYNGKKKEVIDGVMYERFGNHHLSPKIGMFAYQFMLPFMIKQKKHDLWFESFCPPFTTAMLPLLSNKPVIGVVHMLAAEDMERKYKLPFHLVQNFGLKTYRSIIATSEGLKQKIQTIHPKGTITVISNGIEKVFTPLKKREKYILFLGRIEYDQKGLDLLLDGFSSLTKQIRGYKLVIAGSGDPLEIEKVEQKIAELHLQKEVILKGKTTGKAKELLFRNATATVIPSRFETYSLVALESMAYGTPVIAFGIDGLSWISKKAALKVKPYDTALLAKAMLTIITDGMVTESLKKEGNNYAKNFTWEAIANKYVTIINQTLK